jgi:hypothetical protein
MTPTTKLSPALLAIYDLREDGWDMACRHARLWGPLYVKSEWLFADRIVLAFHPAPDPSWRTWEAHRLSDIFAELWPPKSTAQGGEAA